MGPIVNLYVGRTATTGTPSTTLNSPSNSGTVSTTTPTVEFTGVTSTGDQNISYEVQIDTVNTFSSQTPSQNVTVEVWGAGGGGGGGGAGTETTGGGGGGGAYSQSVETISNGTGYTISVGTAGSGGGTGNNGISGGDSYFNTSGTVFAKGGSYGTIGGASFGVGGSGGSAGSGVGTITTGGGTGGTSVTLNDGGGGGGSGGNTTGGGAGGTITAGAAGTTNGALGGVGGSSSNGSAGATPGGGGGGAGSGTVNGANGGSGQVTIFAPLGTVTSATGGTHTADATNDYWTFTTSGTWTPSTASPLIDAKSATNTGFADVTSPVTPSIGHVQTIGSVSGNSVASVTITPAGNTTNGNDIIVAVSFYVASGAYPTCVITDSAGNTYNTIYSFVGSATTGPSVLVAQAHKAHPVTTSQTIKATFTGTAPFSTTLAEEFSGLSAIQDGSILTASGDNTTMTFGTLTTTNAVDLVLAVTAPFGNLVAPTWSSGWSNNDWKSAGPSIGMAWQLPTSTGSFSGTATISTTEFWQTALIALQANVGDPFPSGDEIGYTIPGGEALTNTDTYYWRARQIVPTNNVNYDSAWSSIYNFTVSTGVSTNANMFLVM